MRNISLAAILSGTTALVLPMAGAAQAQTPELVGACGDLYLLVDENRDSLLLLEEFADAEDVALANVDAQCLVYVERVNRVGGIAAVAGGASDTEVQTQGFTESQTVTETVEVTKEALVEGEVIVRIPEPQIGIENAGAEIQIQEATSSVAVDQAPATIMIRQAAATINLSMPQPTITIDQPAPEITVTMPAPDVRLDKGVPQVSVTMGEPRVTVSQADPEIDVQVAARLVDPGTVATNPGEGVVARTERLGGGTADGGTGATVDVSSAEPVVRIVPAEQEQTYAFNRAEPQVQFEAADPVVLVTSEGEPTIQIRQVGEPTILFVEQDGSDVQDAAAVAPVVAADADSAAAARMSEDETADFLREPAGGMMVGDRLQLDPVDLDGRDVLTADGENVGSIEDVVSNGNRMFVVVEHGGFLGIGDSEVTLPLDRIALRGDEVVLLGLTEEDLEAMPDYDAAANVSLEPGTMVDIDTLAN